MLQASYDFRTAIKELREVTLDIETAAKISTIADCLVESYDLREKEIYNNISDELGNWRD